MNRFLGYQVSILDCGFCLLVRLVLDWSKCIQYQKPTLVLPAKGVVLLDEFSCKGVLFTLFDFAHHLFIEFDDEQFEVGVGIVFIRNIEMGQCTSLVFPFSRGLIDHCPCHRNCLLEKAFESDHMSVNTTSPIVVFECRQRAF